MKKIISIIIFLFVVSPVFMQAQVGKAYLLDSDNINDSVQQQEKRMLYNFNAGVGMSFYDDNFFATGFAAPEIGYKLSDKFSLSGGFALSYSMLPTQFDGNSRVNSTSYALFVKGNYQLSPKFNVYGAAAVSFDTYYNRKTPAYSGVFGANYKINENTSIGITIRVQKDNNPYSRFYGLSPMSIYSTEPYNNILFH